MNNDILKKLIQEELRYLDEVEATDYAAKYKELEDDVTLYLQGWARPRSDFNNTSDVMAALEADGRIPSNNAAAYNAVEGVANAWLDNKQ